MKMVYTKSFKSEEFQIKLIPNYHTKTNESITKIIGEMRDLMIKSWGEGGKLIEEWVYSADVIGLAYKNGELRSFSIVNYEEKNTLYLRATVVHPYDSRKGLCKFMNCICIKYILEKKHYCIWKFWRWLDVIYFVFCTANPLLYAIVSKNENVYPSMDKRQKISLKDEEVLLNIVKKFAPRAKYDIETSVLKEDLKSYPSLIYEEKSISWSDDKKVNDFFETTLRLK
ncbi:MAG: hypothetical protein NC820_06260 [Candidatus Omnitrophica bacterium]|nr:hypothetical protein [Candidatus Omnitrophota bacterium]